MWTPGYWAYGADGYYWVAGAWVPSPYEGALWTPPYWGWGGGGYLFHAGYWGPAVGYYGGINYGFGYMGVGFVGGEWREHHFFYNTAIVNVNRTYIHHTYINRTIIRDHTIVNNNHIAFSGGLHGVQHEPTPQERRAMHEQHMAPTRFQEQHAQEARMNRENSFNVNHGRPQNAVLNRPLAAEHTTAPRNRGNERNGVIANRNMGENRNDRKMQPINRPVQGNARENGNARITANPQQQRPFAQDSRQQRQQQQERTVQQQRSMNENRANQNRAQERQQSRPQQESRPQAQPNRAPQQQNRPQAQQQRAPQFRQAPQPRAESRRGR
jgi:hypothetical protein